MAGPGGAVNVGSIYADLDVKTGNLEQGLARGRKALAAIESELRNLDAAFQQGSIYSTDYARRTRELSAEHYKLATAMGDAYQKIGITGSGLDIYNKAATAAHMSTRGLGMGMLQLGYAVDDIRYGFSAIVNNIGPLVYSMGGGPGLAGVVQIAGVATYELYNHWDDLLGLFGSGKVKTEAEEMAELRKQTKLTADEAERLYRAEQLKSKTTELRQGKTESEREAESTATKAIIEAGIRDVVAGVRKNAPELLEGMGDVPAAREELEREKKAPVGHLDPKTGEFIVSDEDTEKSRARIIAAQKNYHDALDRAAESIVATGALPQLFTGNAGKLAELIKKNPGDFGSHTHALEEGLRLAQKQADVTPEQRQRKKIADALAGVGGKFMGHVQAKVDQDVKKEGKQEDKDEAAKKRDNARARNEALARMHQDAQAFERKQRQDAADTRDKIPGFEKIAEDLTLRAMVAGEKPETVEARLKELIKQKTGLNDLDAGAVAEDAAKDAKKKVGDRIVGRALGNDGEPNRHTPSKSEVYASSELTHRVQSAIGTGDMADNTKKLVDVQTQALNYLAQIVRMGGSPWGVN